MATQRIEATPRRTRRTALPGWIPLLLLPAVAFLIRNRVPAWTFMWALAFAIFAGLKWQSWWTSRIRASGARSLTYLLAWPGMDADAFLDQAQHPPLPHPRDFLLPATKTAIGALILWEVARSIPPAYPLARGWAGLFGLLLHFGSFHLLALFWQSMGINAQPIMAEPLSSKSLSEFWGKRWNLGFHQLAFDIIFRPLHRPIGAAGASLLVFLASGMIHDLVISVPARGGYGLPTAYFLLQGFGVMVERSRFGKRIGLQRGVPGWLFLLTVAATPAFWLFHPPFVLRVILPFMQAVHAL